MATHASTGKTLDPAKVGIIDSIQVRHMLGVSDRMVQKYLNLEQDPLPVYSRSRGGSVGGGHKYNIQDVFEWGIRYRFKDQMANTGDGDEQVMYNPKAEQARLHKEKADGEAIKNLILRREYAPVSLLGDSLSDLAGQVNAILGALPSQLKLRFSWLTGAQINLIRTEVVKAQNQAADARIDIVSLYSKTDTEGTDDRESDAWLE